MVCVWKSLALFALCHSCLPRSEASISIIERDVEPVTFVTAAATSDSEPIWLVLPMLLDVQPVLLKVDVTRHVPAQIQSFCQEHGVHRTRCTGAIRQALDGVVDFQRFCKKSTVESALPGFVVTKNAIRGDGGAATGSWLQNDLEDVAIDFCTFAQEKTTVLETDECIEVLGKSLRLSFDWILALTPCEQESSSSHEGVTSDSETQSVSDRIATVEEMIAELQSNSAAKEISEAEEQDILITEENTVNMQEVYMESAGLASSAIESTGVTSNIDQPHDYDQNTVYDHDQYHEPGELNQAEAEEMVVAAIAPKSTKEEGIVDSMGAGNGSCEAAYTKLEEEEPSRINEKQKTQKTWKVCAALVLALSIVYFVIDLMIHCLQYVAGHLGFSKQFVRVQHDISLLVGRGSRGTSKDASSGGSGSEDFKNPMLRQPKPSEKTFIQSKYGGKQVETTTKKSSMKRRASAPVPHCHSPSFTCVAMMLMTSRNDSILAKTTDLPTSSLVAHDCNKALTIIQRKYERELVAAQRIQKAWKAAQHKNGRGKFDTNTPIIRQAQLKSKPTEQTPRVETGSTGLCRLVVNTLPPTA